MKLLFVAPVLVAVNAQGGFGSGQAGYGGGGGSYGANVGGYGSGGGGYGAGGGGYGNNGIGGYGNNGIGGYGNNGIGGYGNNGIGGYGNNGIGGGIGGAGIGGVGIGAGILGGGIVGAGIGGGIGGGGIGLGGGGIGLGGGGIGLGNNGYNGYNGYDGVNGYTALALQSSNGGLGGGGGIGGGIGHGLPPLGHGLPPMPNLGGHGQGKQLPQLFQKHQQHGKHQQQVQQPLVEDIQVEEYVSTEGPIVEDNVDSYTRKKTYAITHRPVYHKTVYNHYTATDRINKDVVHHVGEKEVRNFDVAGKEIYGGSVDIQHGNTGYDAYENIVGGLPSNVNNINNINLGPMNAGGPINPINLSGSPAVLPPVSLIGSTGGVEQQLVGATPTAFEYNRGSLLNAGSSRGYAGSSLGYAGSNSLGYAGSGHGAYQATPSYRVQNY